MNLLEISKIIIPLILIIGLISTFWQLYITNKQRKAELISKVLFKILDDEDISSIFKKIDYDDFKFDKKTHQFESSDEKALDKLLTLLNSLAMQYDLNLIKINDLDEIKYELLITYRNKKVQKYLSNLDKHYNDNKIGIVAYDSFRNLVKEIDK